MKLNQDEIQTGESTYCPEDNKLRLYVGHVPREEFTALRAEGWKSTPKQDCDFVATWTPAREDTATAYGEGEILDEDQTPEERAADRAERFGGYLDKRLSEAHAHAGNYHSQPAAHGFQSQAKADRAARKHDRHAGRALSAWDRADYWQHRTAGVIRHALHLSRPDVRAGRIRKLEAEQRKAAKSFDEYADRFARWQAVAALTDPREQFDAAYKVANYCSDLGSYRHPRPDTVQNSYIRENGCSLYSLLTLESDPITGAEAADLWLSGRIAPDSPEFQQTGFARWQRHYVNRLAYENAMLDAVGGAAGIVEMKPGGFYDGLQIFQVHKSPATKRVTSLTVWGEFTSWKLGDRVKKIGLHRIDITRDTGDHYREPTAEELEAFKAKKAKKNKAAPKLINPTREEAERLQALLNEGLKPSEQSEVWEMTQAQYSARSKGDYGPCETRFLKPGGLKALYRHAKDPAPTLCKIRVGGASGYGFRNAERVVVLTDKPQKPLPADTWKAEQPEETPAPVATTEPAAKTEPATYEQPELLTA